MVLRRNLKSLHMKIPKSWWGGISDFGLLFWGKGLSFLRSRKKNLHGWNRYLNTFSLSWFQCLFRSLVIHIHRILDVCKLQCRAAFSQQIIWCLHRLLFLPYGQHGNISDITSSPRIRVALLENKGHAKVHERIGLWHNGYIEFFPCRVTLR